MISVNKSKAIEIVRDRLRTERQPRLEALDLSWMLAQESGADASEIVDEKQALRDVTDKPLSDLTLEILASLTLDDALAL